MREMQQGNERDLILFLLNSRNNLGKREPFMKKKQKTKNKKQKKKKNSP